MGQDSYEVKRQKTMQGQLLLDTTVPLQGLKLRLLLPLLLIKIPYALH
jgi:hypothetical protein